MKMLIVKSRLLDEANFYAQIAGIGEEMSPVIWQHERVYVPHNYREGQNLPRMITRTEVRNTNAPAVYSLHLKRHIEDSGIDWVNMTMVSDYNETSGIIHQLGFQKIAEISRQRRELRLDERTILYLDQVEGIATPYLKIEARLEEGEPVDALRGDLFKILEMLGQKTFVMETYAKLAGRGNGAIGEEFLLPS